MRECSRLLGQYVLTQTVRDSTTGKVIDTQYGGAVPMGSETIVDQNNGRARPPSYCRHEVHRWTSIPRWTIKYPLFGYEIDEQANASIGDAIDNAVQSSWKPFRDGVDNSASRIIAHATRIADEVSLLNNLIEIPELPALTKKYASIASKLGDGRGGMPLPNFLDWQFGIAPLARDLRTLADNITNVRQRIQNLAAGKSQSISRVWKGSIKATVESSWGVDLNIQGSASSTLNGQITAVIPGLHEAEFQLKVLADVVGLHLDPGVVYDALPFSWLVDWFLPIGQQLEQFNSRQWVKVDLAGQVHLAHHASGGMYCTIMTGTPPQVANGAWSIKDGKPGAGTFKYYQRIPYNFGRPKRTKPLGLSVPDFDVKKPLILASLFQAKRTSRRRG